MSFQNKDKKEDKLKDYVEVNKRIEMFWAKYPNGRIDTHILSWENGLVIMKASAYNDINSIHPSAVGHAYEIENSSYITKTSVLEVCETSAVGRALANMGFEIKKSVASKEEVQRAMELQEEMQADKTKDPAFRAKYNLLKGSSEGFAEFIELMKGKGYSVDQIDEYMTKKIMERKAANEDANQS